jgi:hypothetical protein
MHRTYRECSSPLRVGLVAIGLVACGTEAPPHYNYPEAQVRLDGSITWPEMGQVPDSSVIKLDGVSPTPDARGDSLKGDGPAPSCPGPPAAKCASCSTGEVCTEAKGGMCVKQVVLIGPATDKAVLKLVAMAYVSCWAKAPADDTLCATFNTCDMTGALTDAIVSDWICNKAQVGDFPSSTEYDAARGLSKCSIWQGQFVYRPDWKVGSIISGKKGTICLTYDKNPWYSFDRLNVNDCQYFPPT